MTGVMLREIGQGLRFGLVTLALFGAGYPLVLLGVGAVGFRAQAEGSLLRRSDGTPIGSRLIAQPFARDGYAHPRPSAVDFNAASAGGSNLAVSNPDQRRAVADRLRAFQARDGAGDPVPSEMVTASGSGLDPDIPPAAAARQAARIAAARRVTIEAVLTVVDAHTRPPLFGFYGRARVNVLELNLALDEAFGGPPPAAAPVPSVPPAPPGAAPGGVR